MVLLAQEASAGLEWAAEAEEGRDALLVTGEPVSLADGSLHGGWVQGRKETGSFRGVWSAPHFEMPTADGWLAALLVLTP